MAPEFGYAPLFRQSLITLPKCPAEARARPPRRLVEAVHASVNRTHRRRRCAPSSLLCNHLTTLRYKNDLGRIRHPFNSPRQRRKLRFGTAKCDMINSANARLVESGLSLLIHFRPGNVHVKGCNPCCPDPTSTLNAAGHHVRYRHLRPNTTDFRCFRLPGVFEVFVFRACAEVCFRVV